MKILIVALVSLCAASAFAQQRNSAPPPVGTSVEQAGTQAQHPVPVEVRHSSNTKGVSQVLSSSSAHTVVWRSNTGVPAPHEVFSSSSGTAAAMPRALATHPGTIVLHANENAPAPAHLESTGKKTEQK